MRKRLDIINRTYFTCIAVFIIAPLLVNSGCPFSKKSSLPDIIKDAARAPVGGVIVSTAVNEHSPEGIRHTGKTAMTAAQLNLADQGISDLNAAFVEDGFTVKPLPHSFYRISTPIYPCVPSPILRVPSFVVNGGHTWDGSEYDQYNTEGKLGTPFRDAEGILQVYKKDGKSVVFAPEMILSTGNSHGQTEGWMHVCPNDSVVRNAVRHGGDHIKGANFAYNEANRSRPPYDGWNFFNCSIHHGNGVNHPLFPRNGRCVSTALIEEPLSSDLEGIGQEIPIPGEISERFAEEGFALSDDVVMIRGLVTRPAK